MDYPVSREEPLAPVIGSPGQTPGIGNLLKVSHCLATFQLMHAMDNEQFDPCSQPALRIGARAVRFAKMQFDNAIRPAALFKIRRGVIVGHGFHALR